MPDARIELTIVLPLGVVANQLMKIEADLRFLNMKALVYARDDADGTLAAQIAGRLDKINESLELIRSLVSSLQTDIQPQPARPARTSSRDRED